MTVVEPIFPVVKPMRSLSACTLQGRGSDGITVCSSASIMAPSLPPLLRWTVSLCSALFNRDSFGVQQFPSSVSSLHPNFLPEHTLTLYRRLLMSVTFRRNTHSQHAPLFFPSNTLRRTSCEVWLPRGGYSSYFTFFFQTDGVMDWWKQNNYVSEFLQFMMGHFSFVFWMFCSRNNASHRMFKYLSQWERLQKSIFNYFCHVIKWINLRHDSQLESAMSSN